MNYRPQHLRFLVLLGVIFSSALTVSADEQMPNIDVPTQPLLAQVHRLSEALEVVGRP